MRAALRQARATLHDLAARSGAAEDLAAAERAREGLDLIGRELEDRYPVSDQGLDELSDAIFGLASLDFTRTLRVSGDGTVMDGLRGCVNMLSEELAAQHREMEQTNRLAAQAAVAKTDFLSNMSHELRTPMHAILNFTEMGLARISGTGEVDRARMEKYLTNIRVSGKRLLSLIDDLLDLSKLEAGKTQFVALRTDITPAINQALAELDSLFKAKAIQCVVRHQTAECDAFFDIERMIQVMANILGNALRFALPGSIVEITLRDGPGTLLCDLHNEGPSIPDGELETIFDRFVQSSRVKNGAGGTGLGLAICRAIMEAHGGRIWAENVPPGVTMHLAIPRLPPLPSPPLPPSLESPSGGRTVPPP